jgi:hypothetical protein
MMTNIKRIGYKSTLFSQTNLAQIAQPNMKKSPPIGVTGPSTKAQLGWITDKRASP